jgi:hypothetical protein
MFSLRNEKKNVKVILGVVCTLFFLLCILCIFKYGVNFGSDKYTLMGDLNNPNNDDVKFIRSAWILAETGKYVYHRPANETVFMMPGLPYTLAFFVKIFGKFGGITAFRIFQTVIQTSSLMLVFFIGRKIFNSKVGLIALILNAFYAAEIWVSNLIITETIFKFFVLCLVYFSIYAIENKKTRYYIMGGIAWGFATLFRPTITTFPIIILIMWILRKYTFKDILKYTLVVSLIFCLILSPWWIRNYRIFNRFIPLTLATGNPMLQGTYINYDQSTRDKDALDYSQFNYSSSNTEIENNEIEMAISKYRLKNLVPKQPLRFLLWYTLGKAAHQISWPMYWVEILGINLVLAGVYHYILLIFGAMGISAFYKNNARNTMGNIIFATIIYFIAAYLPFYAFSRYFYPAMPFVIIFAAERILNRLVKWKLASRFRI